jgi:outer membrane murein-binding lipoprotein Lpp
MMPERPIGERVAALEERADRGEEDRQKLDEIRENVITIAVKVGAISENLEDGRSRFEAHDKRARELEQRIVVLEQMRPLIHGQENEPGLLSRTSSLEKDRTAVRAAFGSLVVIGSALIGFAAWVVANLPNWLHGKP